MFRPVPGSLLGIIAPVLVVGLVDAEAASDVASSRLSMVIAGLIGLAVVIAVSTFFFWRATRPDRASGAEIGIRWIQPDEQNTPWATAPAPTPTSPPAARDTTSSNGVPSVVQRPSEAPRPPVAQRPSEAPRPPVAPRPPTAPSSPRPAASPAPSGPPPESPAPDYGALRARPADG